VTRPASKSLDEDETPSLGPSSGSSEALRLLGSLNSKEGEREGKKRGRGGELTSGAGKRKERESRGESGCAKVS